MSDLKASQGSKRVKINGIIRGTGEEGVGARARALINNFRASDDDGDIGRRRGYRWKRKTLSATYDRQRSLKSDFSE